MLSASSIVSYEVTLDMKHLKKSWYTVYTKLLAMSQSNFIIHWVSYKIACSYTQDYLTLTQLRNSGVGNKRQLTQLWDIGFLIILLDCWGTLADLRLRERGTAAEGRCKTSTTSSAASKTSQRRLTKERKINRDTGRREAQLHDIQKAARNYTVR